MLQLAQRIHHRDLGVLGHLLDGGVGKCPQDNGVHPAFQVVSDVAQFLACIETALRLIDEEGNAAQARHAGFKR